MTHFFRPSYQKKLEKLELLCRELNGTVQRDWRYPTLRCDLEGRRLRVMPITARYKEPLVIQINFNAPFMAWIYRSNDLHNFLGQMFGPMGLGKQSIVKSYDQTFDTEYRVYSNQGCWVEKYLHQDGVLDAVRNIFVLGFTTILLDSQQIIITKPKYDFNKDLELANIVAITSQLKRFPLCDESADNSNAAKIRNNSNLLILGNFAIFFIIFGCFFIFGPAIVFFTEKTVPLSSILSLIVGTGLLGFGSWIACYCEKFKVGK